MSQPPTRSVAIVWAQYGPYHCARARAFARVASPAEVVPVEIAPSSRDYQWKHPSDEFKLVTLCPTGLAEDLRFLTVFHRARRAFAGRNVSVCMLPSYSPRQSLAVLLAAKSLGIRTVMMNESHAGTSQAQGAQAFAKRRLVRLFDTALVGGQPQKRHFASMGLPEERIFTGYDAVDNDFFCGRAEEVRRAGSELRARYGLPNHYFLSLGRFVAKKNLPTLLRAYRLFLDASPDSETHLVLVGSGEEERHLRELCAEYQLPVYEKHSAGQSDGGTAVARGRPGVHFYGFRQIEENPVFYGLADAFILPSSREEWGLVVNEAMAAGLPVVVSETAGCVEDLLEPYEGAMTSSVHVRGLAEKWRLARVIRQNGFVFDPTCSDELSRILLLLEHAVGLRSVMGQASRRIIEKFSCENFARNALSAVQAALERPHAANAIPAAA